MTTSTGTDCQPRVRVGYPRCDAAGHNRGVWVPATKAADVTTDDVHRGSIVRLESDVDLHVDCLTAVEVQYIPTETPMFIERATAWGELYEEIGAAQWPAFLAWIDAGVVVEDGDGLPSGSAFEERYCGEWESFEDYAHDLDEDMGLMQGWPETAVRYFDWVRWARDERAGYTVVDAPHGVYIYRDL